MPQKDERREADQLPDIPAPEQTSQLFGHHEQLKVILDGFDTGRLHHGWLIHGPRGIGKATFAYEVAKSLLIRSSGESKKRVESQVSAGAHPNLKSLRIGRNPGTGRFRMEILVDEVRALIHQFEVSSGRAGARLAVVDCVEDLNQNAANALLKVLEEPPKNSFFLLISQRPGLILPTIRSRTSHLALRPLEAKDTRASVRAALDDIGDKIGLEAACERSAGHPRLALEELVLTDGLGIGDLANWLSAAKNRTGSRHMAIAQEIAAEDTGAYGRAVRLLSSWIAAQSRSRSMEISGPDPRLAMLMALWEKADALVGEQAIYNLDRRQTLVMIMDAICDLDRL